MLVPLSAHLPNYLDQPRDENDKAKLVKQRVATYTTQLGDDVVYAERATKLMVIGQDLDILERL